MQRALIGIMFLALAGMAAFFGGCSGEDDKVVNPPARPTPQDSVFVETFFTPDQLTTSLQLLPLSVTLLQYIPHQGGRRLPSALKALQGNDSVIIDSTFFYVYASGWHIFGIGARLFKPWGHDTVAVVGLDSIQIIADGAPVQYPDIDTVIDTLKERVHVAFEMVPVGNHGSANHGSTVALEYSGADTVATLNGLVRDTSFLSGDVGNGACEVKLTSQQTVTGLRITSGAEDGDCPLAGTVTMRAGVRAFCTGGGEPPPDTLRVKGDWLVTMQVNDNGTVTITYSRGGLVWSRTTNCKGELAGSLPDLWPRPLD